MNKEDVLKKCDQKNVHFVHLQFSDLLGMVKSVTIPVEKLENAIDHNLWFDGSSVEGFARIYESDMYLKPDLSTFSFVPWESNEKRSIARILCDVYLPDGKPFEGDPRHILRRQVEKSKKMGFDYFVGPELEFFLFPTDDDKNPILKPHDSAGYFDYSTDRGGVLRYEMSTAVSQMGVDVEAIHHEVAPGQHEIDFKYSDAISQADQVITVKTALKAVARKFDLYATFMPKPLSGMNGSGMHVHQSLWKKGENAFYDAKQKYSGLSKMAQHFIAGQLKYISEISAITNPTVNSYKRLIPGFEAPIYVAWGQFNRSALIRIPRITEGKQKEATRCEIRSPDSSSNPYLAFAVMLAAGLKGIEEKMQAPDPIDEDVYAFTDKKAKRMRIRTLPESLQQALQQMEKSDLVKEVLGDHAFERFVEAKREEVNESAFHVSEWERQRYFSVY